jgi:hypothetical protein
MSYENAVLLIPGSLGFGRLGNFYYFADRIAACLQAMTQIRSLTVTFDWLANSPSGPVGRGVLIRLMQ